jgi:hypothetical protein
VTGSISAAALSFIVHEPSGIIEFVSDRSRPCSFESQRIISVSLRIEPKRLQGRALARARPVVGKAQFRCQRQHRRFVVLDAGDGGQEVGHVAGTRGLVERHADAVRVHAQVDALGLGRRQRAAQVRRREIHTQGVEARARARRASAARQALRQRGGELLHAARDALEALGPVPHAVARGDVGEQHLRRADVRGGLLAADVLLARLQRQAQRALAALVDRHPGKASGQRALVGLLGREVRGVRSAVAQRNAEALHRTDAHVGAEFTGRREQHQGQRIGGHDHQRTGGVRALAEAR